MNKVEIVNGSPYITCDVKLTARILSADENSDYFKKENMVYINIANNISIDCDCDNNPHDPEMKDIGIFASTDPVAIDKCCYDTIINSEDKGKDSLVKRMESKHAIHTVEMAEKLELGTTNYEIIDIDLRNN